MICRKCLEDKDSSEFYPSNKYQCKACAKEYTKLYWRRNPEKHRVNHAKRDKGRMAAYYKRWYAKNGRKKNAKQSHSHAMVHAALLDGSLINPNLCECCRGVKKVEAHHDDYDKVLDVRWLCRPCHRQQHTGR